MTRLPASSRKCLIVRRQGFTLVEVLLVLAILGVIAAMVVPNLLGQQRAAYIKTTAMTIKTVEDASKAYAIAHDGTFPASIGLLTNPDPDKNGTATPFLEKSPKDAWGMDFNYEFPSGKIPGGLKPAIWSNGPDKISEDGNGDDVNNWSK